MMTASSTAPAGALEPGALVKLVSGGPLMTVTKGYEESVMCTWFDGATCQTGSFYRSTIQPVPGEAMVDRLAEVIWRKAIQADVLTLRVATLESAVRWALGHDEGEPEFRGREEGDGAYWWRVELQRRARVHQADREGAETHG